MKLPPITYYIPATSQEEDFNEFRKSLIKTFEGHASNQRMQGRIARTKKALDNHIAKSESYEYVVSMLRAITFKLTTEENCPGHVASAGNVKVCIRCGIHIDSLRPDNGDFRCKGDQR